MIPVNEPFVGEKELQYVSEAIKTGWISSSGKFIKSFEDTFADYIQKKHGIVVNNGTNALILALRALDLPKNSEVIIPSFTIISCALACIYNELVPVFVDSEEDTWNMNVSKVEEKITKNTKAIMPVHIYGHPVDMESVKNLAEKHDLYIVEDFAEAIGSEFQGQKCGSFGDISCTSFYANKTITTGEGGMCLTDRDEIAEKMRRLSNLGFIPEKRFVHFELGFNFRMTNIQAAIGLAQLEQIDEFIEKKRWIGHTYLRMLNNLEQRELIQLPVEKTESINTYWMFGIVLHERLHIDAETIMKKLSAKGIQTRPFFYPLHLQPAFKDFSWYKRESLPVSERLYQNGFYLPSGMTLQEAQIEQVCSCLKDILG